MDTLLNYLEAARGIAAVNPKHQKLVNRLAVADRKVDFHVDAAALAEEGKGYGEFDAEQQAAAKKHLRAEEKWFGVVQEIEQQLPKREIANTYKQLHANIFVAPELDYEQSQFRLESARYASSLRMLHNRLAKIKATLNSEGQS